MNKILVTGGTGLVGNAFKRLMPTALFPTRKELDLLDRNNVFDYFSKNDINVIFHIAGRVGGVAANTDYVSDFYSENIQMNTNILDAAVFNRVKNVVCCLSTCIYPDSKYVTYPLTEHQLHNGPPHESNFGYAYAKRMVDIQLKAIRQQHGFNYISVVPNNLYGPNDNFDLNNGHVLPSLIRKIWEAKINNKPFFEVWGDGEVYREFTFSDDIAKIIVFCMNNYEGSEPINIGSTAEYLLKDVIDLICKELGFNGEIKFDISKPKGQIRKPTCNEKLLKIGWEAKNYTSLQEGLRKTCSWFKQNYPNIRGIS
jgi:GDP-L-fucose synthase